MIRKTALALPLLAALAVPAAAAPGSIELCSEMGEIAQSMMELRQAGAPMHYVANGIGAELDGPELDFTLALMEAAYEEPLYSGPEYQRRAAHEFASDVFRMCRED